MFSALIAHPQTSTKRMVIYLGCVSVLFLAAVLFSFHGRLQTPKGIPTRRVISAAPERVQPRLGASYGKLPLSFEANHGQTDPRVKFVSRGPGYTLFLAGDEALLALRKSSVVSGQSSVGTTRNPRVRTQKPEGKTGRRATDNGLRTTDSVLRMKLVGANANAPVMGSDELPGKANYFIGNDPKKWRTNVPTYAKVRYHDVYPGVDLVYYGNQGGQLEYDFIVAPGADPRAITLDVGAGIVPARGRPQGSPLRIARDGDLVISAGGGELRFHKPLVYQQEESGVRSQESGEEAQLRNSIIPRQPAMVNRPSSIANRQFRVGRFVLDARDRIHFTVDLYDHAQRLVIDPVLVYSTYLGGMALDYGYGIAVDSSGNAYVTGSTTSNNFPVVNPIEATHRWTGLADAFVSKLNATGSALIYSTYLGGSSDNRGYGIAVDSSGSAYVTGTTDSPDFPTVNPLQATNKGSYNAFVAKLDPTGSALVYSTFLGGNGRSVYGDGGNGIAVDSSGNAYVAGYTSSSNFPATPGAFQTSLGSTGLQPDNAFVSKLDPTGSALVYSTYLGGSGGPTYGDEGNGIVVDSSGNAYVAGYTGSTNFPATPGAFQTSLGGTCTQCVNAFASKLNPTGSALVYSTYLGGNDEDFGYGIAVDSSGNAYVTGQSRSANFPTANPIQTGAGMSTPGYAFVSKLNPTGTGLVYSTYLGSGAGDTGNGIALDSSGNTYVIGSTPGSFPIVKPLQPSFGGGSSDAFVAKLNWDGSALSLAYSTYLGGTSSDGGQGIAVDSSGNAYVIGYTSSTNFPFTPGAFQTSLGGNNATDAFVAKISASAAPVVTFSSDNLAFGSLPVDKTSPAQSVTLTNSGPGSLTITSVAMSGDFAFVTTGTSCPYAGGTVAPAGTCTLDVTFTPTATGQFTGSVTLTDNNNGVPNSTQAISLTGTGIEGPLAGVSPGSLTFSAQAMGTTSAAQQVKLSNTGNAELTITSIGVSADFSQTNNCGSGVAINGSCTINVSFTPNGAGSLAGSLTITDNAANSPQAVQLSGTGMDFQLSSTATSQTVARGQVANYSLTLAPEGGFNQTINLTCTGAPSESTCTLTPNTATLNGAASATVAVAVSTTAPSLAPPQGQFLPPGFSGLGRMVWLYALLGLASLAMLAAARKRGAAYLLGACVLLVMLWSACGGGGTSVPPISKPGTPAGTYTVDVTATDATSSTLTHDFKFTLTVN